MNNVNEGNKKKYFFLEIFAVVFGSIALFLVFANFALGGPNSTDVTWYMNVGLNGIKDPAILNRYFHIFLETIFLEAAPTPLVGLQYFWAFLVTGICLLVYITARNLNYYSHPFHGLLAVSLFLTMGVVADTAGMPLVDITATFMLLMMVSVFVHSVRNRHKYKWLIIIFGVLFLLAFKTKETTLSALILFLGYGFNDEDTWDWKVFAKRLVLVLLGVIIGGLFYTFLNAVFLKDPLFGLRPEEIRKFLSVYFSGTQTVEKFGGTINWYTGYLLDGMWIPFILYLISGAKVSMDSKTSYGIRVLWLLPLMEILLVTGMVGSIYGFQPRFIVPALPIICLLGPQFLDLNLKSVTARKEQIRAAVILVVSLILVVLVRLVMRRIFQVYGWDISTFMVVVFIPVVFSLILALVFFFKRMTVAISFIIAVLIISIVAIPLTHNIKQMVINHPNRNFSERLFYPFAIFSEQINYSPEIEFYISPNVWRMMETSYFTKDRLEISSLFNVYFDVSSTKNNFLIPKDFTEMSQKLSKSNFSYVLLSLNDWQTISSDQELKDLVAKRYHVYFEGENKLVLLKSKALGPENQIGYPAVIR